MKTYYDRVGYYNNNGRGRLSFDLSDEFKKKKIGYYRNKRIHNMFDDWVSLR